MNIRKSFWLFKSAIDILKDKGAPNWLHNHTKLKNKKLPNKIFPSVGLNNFREKIKLDFSFPEFKKEKDELVFGAIKDMEYRFIGASDQFKDLLKEANAESKEIKAQLNEIVNFISALVNAFKWCIENKSTTMPYAIKLFDKNMANKDQKLTSVYSVVREALFKIWGKYTDKKMYYFGTLDEMPTVKYLNSFNLPDKEYEVVFSADGDVGAWDIATMSERGITSCQSWKEGERKVCLVGSVLSKYVGIIYLTGGASLERGEKMIRRCLVRYGIRNGNPIIILDRMYDRGHILVKKAFLDALKRHTSLPVVSSDELGGSYTAEVDVEIPFDEEIADLDAEEMPYIDTPYKNKTPFKENVMNLLSIEDLPGDIQARIYRENKGNKEVMMKMLNGRDNLDLLIFDALVESSDEDILAAAATNVNIQYSANLQDKLAKSTSEKVKINLLNNPEIFKSVIEKMLNDSSVKVRELAQKKLKDAKDFGAIPDDE